MPTQPTRVALVTGGSAGIGRGAAFSLAADGTAVVVHGLDAAEADQTAAEIVAAGGQAIGMAGPIEDPATSVAAVDLAVEHFGRLDVLVTSAGIQRYGDAVSTPPHTWLDVMAVNVHGVYYAAHAALPHIREQPAGAVVIVASVQGSSAQNQVAAYSTSKGALHALTRAMAVDEAAYGVRVNSVSPGSVDTPMLRASARLLGGDDNVDAVLADWGTAHPLGRIAQAHEIGDVIAFLCSPRASFITGADIRADGGLLARLAAPLPKQN